MAVKCRSCQTENPSDSKFCKVCATPLLSSRDVEIFQTKTLETPGKELTTGSIFAGRYQIIEELGRGGMGQVYRAYDIKLKEEVALKLIISEIAADKRTLERFHNEIKLARKISHPHVGRMYELLEENGIHFITMEYVPGEDLKSSIRRFGQLPVNKSVSIAKQICEGLVEAHKTGVIHRDLKPSNIIVDRDGNAKIMDFGIARHIHSKSITGEGVVIGTPEYMSPEQAEGQEVDQRSDLYSLGIILYEMLTGKVPFEGNTPLNIAMKHKLAAPRDPQELVAQLPDDLNLLILRCLEKDREKRYRDADELRGELEEVERSATKEALFPKKKPLGPTRLARIWASIKWKKVVRFGGIGVFLALVIMAGLLVFKGKEEALDSIAVLPFENVNADPDTEYLSDGITETLINKLSRLSVFKKVISRASSFAYKGEKLNPKKVGEELGVKTVLTARMVRYGETISISPALVKTSDNSQLWGEKFTRKFQDIFAIEEDIATAIIAALKLELSGEQKKKISERWTDNAQAYEFYLRAKREIMLSTKEGCDRALQYLEKSLAIVGENAVLNAGKGYVYFAYANMGIGADENGKKAEMFANKALEMDPESSEAHFVLGLVNSAFFGNQRKGVDHLKKALAASPNDGDILWWLCVTYAFVGKMSAVEKMAVGMAEVDPLHSQTGPAKHIFYMYGGQLDLAFDLIRKTPPTDPPGLFVYAWFLIYRKALEEAESIIEKKIEDPKQNFFWQLYFLLKYAAQGDRENFAKWLTPALLFTVKRDPQYSSLMADFYALLGDTEKALDWLDNAASRGFINYPYLNKYDPYLANIRGEPRFKKLMERVKYEWEHFEE